ncbi:hypothetical protein [Breoghania sp.]|uniref:hypothetical protein n=1 Tax=Breoghania sp. TaxID=2065378 RepID=UPI0026220387|nr:hypothetical protein [Breoghania sp.]MDJ0932156.1 hypothetical protein [Breoghania sp.]
MKTIGLVFVAVMVAGCAALSANDIEDIARQEDYFTFRLTPENAQIIGQYVPSRFADYFGIKGTEPRQRIGVGDVLAVNIWESRRERHLLHSLRQEDHG